MPCHRAPLPGRSVRSRTRLPQIPAVSSSGSPPRDWSPSSRSSRRTKSSRAASSRRTAPRPSQSVRASGSGRASSWGMVTLRTAGEPSARLTGKTTAALPNQGPDPSGSSSVNSQSSREFLTSSVHRPSQLRPDLKRKALRTRSAGSSIPDTSTRLSLGNKAMFLFLHHRRSFD